MNPASLFLHGISMSHPLQRDDTANQIRLEVAKRRRQREGDRRVGHRAWERLRLGAGLRDVEVPSRKTNNAISGLWPARDPNYANTGFEYKGAVGVLEVLQKAGASPQQLAAALLICLASGESERVYSAFEQQGRRWADGHAKSDQWRERVGDVEDAFLDWNRRYADDDPQFVPSQFPSELLTAMFGAEWTEVLDLIVDLKPVVDEVNKALDYDDALVDSLFRLVDEVLGGNKRPKLSSEALGEIADDVVGWRLAGAQAKLACHAAPKVVIDRTVRDVAVVLPGISAEDPPNPHLLKQLQAEGAVIFGVSTGQSGTINLVEYQGPHPVGVSQIKQSPGGWGEAVNLAWGRLLDHPKIFFDAFVTVDPWAELSFGYLRGLVATSFQHPDALVGASFPSDLVDKEVWSHLAIPHVGRAENYVARQTNTRVPFPDRQGTLWPRARVQAGRGLNSKAFKGAAWGIEIYAATMGNSIVTASSFQRPTRTVDESLRSWATNEQEATEALKAGMQITLGDQWMAQVWVNQGFAAPLSTSQLESRNTLNNQRLNGGSVSETDLETWRSLGIDLS